MQLFRKDLISAMKLPDNEPLEAEDYWTVTDTWKQEWERGVQVQLTSTFTCIHIILTSRGAPDVQIFPNVIASCHIVYVLFDHLGRAPNSCVKCKQ